MRHLDGPSLRRAMQEATRLLEKHREEVNALNVFPVPDGDTGTNMVLTMQSALAEVARSADGTVSSVASALARGAVLGARGNSGVILSQILQGLSRGLEGREVADAPALVSALEEASASAYSAVGEPVEGTMLTVMQAIAEGARRAVTYRRGGIISLWQRALSAARRALARTPLMLPVLRMAGVVDAGGQGLVIIWEGALASLRGLCADQVEARIVAPLFRGDVSVSEEFLQTVETEQFGFCTQFVVHGHRLDAEDIRRRLSSMAESTVVVGAEGLVRVHVHTHDPDRVVEFARTLGQVTELRVDDMDRQHRSFRTVTAGADTVKVGVVAVAWGEGFVRMFKELGAWRVIPCGRTMNPSTRQILEASQEEGAEEVIVLPNNPNVIPSARQAARMAGRRVHVVPTRSLAEGVSAMLAYNPEEDAGHNVPAMARAAQSVVTIEVCRAIRASRFDGITVKRGEFMGMVNEKLACTARDPVTALVEAVQKAGPDDGQVLTVYVGQPATAEEVEEAQKALEERFPSLEVQTARGGQPLYHFIASLE